MARVLVVDDDVDILRIVETVLRMNNHDVYVAPDAMKAMDLLNASLYDLLITDANMPRFSGFELARNLKNNKRFHKMAICMLTGLREKKDIEKAIRAGVDDYIVKPIDPAVLLQKVEGILLKKPPMERVELNLSEESSFSLAQISNEVRVLQISELGLVLKSAIAIPEGYKININAEIFKKMEMPTAPQLKVISCRKLFEFEYEICVAYVGAGEAFQKKVRAWIHLQLSHRKNVA
jgi:DNA-binding response OmpR family regulator